MERRVSRELEKITQRSISIRSSGGSAIRIAQSGRFKSQFETGTSGGNFEPEMRANAEMKGLGAALNLDAQQRPIYGYIPTSGDHGHWYGGVEFILGEDVKRRATLTVGDSLGRFQGDEAVGVPLLEPDTPGWDTQVAQMYSEGEAGIRGYVEVQIQGGVTLADVERVVIHTADPGRSYVGVSEALRAAGLQVEIDAETF